MARQKIKGISISSANAAGNANATSGYVLKADGSGGAAWSADSVVAGISSSADATAITIDSSENVGIGTSSPSRILDVEVSGGNAIGSVVSGTSNIAGFVFGDTSADDQGGVLYDNSSDFLYFRTGGAERVRVNVTGKVGIGTTSPANNLHIFTDAGDEGITIKSTGNTSNAIIFDANRSGAGSSIGEIQSKWNGTTVAMIASVTGSDTTNKDDGLLAFYTSSANNIAERMRIDSSGDVQIGVTSQISNAKVSIYEASTDAGLFIRKGDGTQSSTNTYIHFDISGGGTAGGKITFGSGGSPQFTATSDERLKENIKEVTGCLDKVMALKPSSFTLTESNLNVPYGFIAQNVETVLPEFVTDDENGYKQISEGLTSPYIAVLTKALQELAAEVEELKTKLESK
jgi:hypothetical protein